MKFVVLACAALAALSVMVPPGMARAEVAQTLRETVVNVEAPLAVPLSEPLRDRFGLGTMPAISATLPAGRWTLLGLRLRGGFLSNGPAPADPSIRDPGMGGLMVLSGVGRFRPLAGRESSRALGPWIEVGVGPGLTGTRVRAVAEAAFGWNFKQGNWIFGPSARYLHVVQPSDALDSSDAQIALIGVEIVLHDARRPTPVVAPASVAVTPPKVVVLDRDGDGIPDAVDKCPDDPEDKDGFQDEDGCPDPDNDKDGIPDVADACPNEPETVNGVDDEDGCPDEAPVVVKDDHILLTEHVLFDSNRARVRTRGRPALAAVINLWKQHPEWDHLVVEGHADRNGPDPFNDWLSNERAVRARKVLVEMGFPADKISVVAFGRRQLRVPGAGEEVDRQNRRVEFAIVKKAAEGRPQAPEHTRPQSPDPTQPPPLPPVRLGGLQP